MKTLGDTFFGRPAFDMIWDLGTYTRMTYLVELFTEGDLA